MSVVDGEGRRRMYVLPRDSIPCGSVLGTYYQIWLNIHLLKCAQVAVKDNSKGAIRCRLVTRLGFGSVLLEGAGHMSCVEPARQGCRHLRTCLLRNYWAVGAHSVRTLTDHLYMILGFQLLIGRALLELAEQHGLSDILWVHRQLLLIVFL